MPELKCTVQTCMHNQNYYCTLDKIQVGGNSAKERTRPAVTVSRREETPRQMHPAAPTAIPTAEHPAWE